MKKIGMFLLIGGIITSLFLYQTKLSAQSTPNYVLERPVISYAGGVDDVIQKIQKQVTRISTANNHELIGGRLWGTENQLLWGHGRGVFAIAQTIPYLSSMQVSAVKTYLGTEMDQYLLNSTYLNSEITGSLGDISWSNNYGFCWDAIYGIWAYAYYTADWAKIQSNWNTIKTIYSTCQTNSTRTIGITGGVSALNNEIAGLMGMARMARHLNDSTTQNAVTLLALSDLTAKSTEIANASNNPIQIHKSPWGINDLGRNLIVSGFQDLTPDVGRYLADTQKAKVTIQMTTVTSRFKTWFLGDLDHVSDWMASSPFPPVTDANDRPGEEGFQMSLFADPIFLSRAYITQEPVSILKNELPLPQSSKTTPAYLDIFRLEHLVAIAHRASTISWQSE